MHVMPDRVQLRSPNFESYINYFELVNFQGELLGENSLEGRGGFVVRVSMCYLVICFLSFI